MTDLHQSWSRAWLSVGARTPGDELRDSLVQRYQESHRRYHTLQHLQECLRWFEAVPGLAAHPAEVELALWFHDAIYDASRADNEEQSAALAEASLRDTGASAESIERIIALVLATKHTTAPSDRDQQVLVDIDLSILGSDPVRFDEYDRQIREEYAFVPEPTFRTKRREVLQAFLDREFVYHTAEFRRALEESARANLRRAVDHYKD